MIIINFNCDLHLGDNIMAVSILDEITKVNDIGFNLYNCNPKLLEFSQGCDRINFHTFEYFGSEKIYNTWCGNYNFNPWRTLKTRGYETTVLDYFKFLFYNIMKINIIFPFDDLFSSSLYALTTLKKLKNIEEYDYLIINSDGLSGQCDNNLKDIFFEKYINNLINKNYSVWCTKYIPNLHENVKFANDLGLRDIGELSLKSKKIVGVATGPMVACYNDENINKEIIAIAYHDIHPWKGNTCTYTLEEFICLTE